MYNFKEVLFISDSSDAANTVDCYDIQLGVRVMMYKNGNGVAKRTLNLLGEDYVITAEVCRPFLRVWPINREEPLSSLRMTMPGRVTALAVSPDGNYSAAAIENKIYIWNIPSGQLLNAISYHHEPITKIIFWNCNYLISSGEDGLVSVWRLADVISKHTGETFSSTQFRSSVPFFASSHHSLPVTDMHLAAVGNTAKLFTVSADQTCHIYSLGPASGRLLLTLNFDFVLTSVITDRLQRKLFVGTNCGKIVLFPMEPSFGSNTYHVDCSKEENIFLGHEGVVTVLSLSWEDNMLASGSEDRKVILWNVSTKQQIRIYEMNGSVTSVMFYMVRNDFLVSEFKPGVMVSSFERSVVNEPENIEIKVMVRDELTFDDCLSCPEEEFSSSAVWNKSMGKRYGIETPPAVVPEGPGVESEEESEVLQEHGDSAAVVPEDEQYGTDSERIPEIDLESEIEVGPVWESQAVTEPRRDLSSREILLESDRIERAERELSRLRFLNRRLRKVNKRLYKFGLEQVLKNRCIQDICEKS